MRPIFFTLPNPEAGLIVHGHFAQNFFEKKLTQPSGGQFGRIVRGRIVHSRPNPCPLPADEVPDVYILPPAKVTTISAVAASTIMIAPKYRARRRERR